MSTQGDKKAGIQTVLKTDPLDGEGIPGLYCSTGVATCKDLDFSQVCICGGCPVFGKYDLGGSQPMSYYCRDGAAG